MLEITRVKNGWFNMRLTRNDGQVFEANCSMYGEADIGLFLLRLANAIVCKQKVEKLVCLNGENIAYRMELKENGSQMLLEIVKLPKDGIHYISASSQRLSDAKVGPTVFSIICDKDVLAKDIFLSFSNYNPEIYSDNWFPFPREEFDLLHRARKRWGID